MDESRNLQNDFFNAARRDKVTLTVFLGNGQKLTGRLKSFDKFTLLVETPQGDQMIFKHAISTVSTAQRSVEVSSQGSRNPGAYAERGSD
jgi:host factor-I protein